MVNRPMTADEINAFMETAFPGSGGIGITQRASPGEVVLRHFYAESQLRPGGTLSGPTMMGLADRAMYALVFAAVGLKPLAVTTSLSINFLRKPAPADLIATARMLKLGKVLAVGDVTIRSDGVEDPVAHAVVTYSLPPK
jgi:acyl-coenzyme A thioesterase PaaI-like protein